MGTRGLNIIIAGGEIKVAQYNQWDSYPEGQGAIVLDFLRNRMKPDFKDKVLACSWISEATLKSHWVECGAPKDSEWVSMEASERFNKKYPFLHRDCGAAIYEYIQESKQGLALQNSADFAADSLFCEWCYVVDLDKRTFEVYKGFNKKPLGKKQRFHFLNEQSRPSHSKVTYYPVRLVKSYSLDNLPTRATLLKDAKRAKE